MKKYYIFFVLLCLVFTSSAQAENFAVTGFVPGQIWYSKDPFIEGDTIKIYTAIWNSGESPLSAKVEFYDKNVILGSRSVVVSASSLQETSISWKVTSGDHSISAKIISPSITSSGKKANVTVVNTTTTVDKRFVPIVINTIEGDPATSSDILKSQIDKATSSLNNIIPESISTPISEEIDVIDDFRADTFKKISDSKIETQNKIDALKIEDNKTSEKVVTKQTNVGIEDATEKPIAYLKLFFFSILSFIFGNKLIFYLLITLIVFSVVRSIYRKIRNR